MVSLRQNDAIVRLYEFYRPKQLMIMYMNNTKLNVWILDPAQLTPYYNITLADALAQVGCNVRYITSPYLYDMNLSYGINFRMTISTLKVCTIPSLSNTPSTSYFERHKLPFRPFTTY